jgi:transcriptional regulator with XRE-family HTH domain
VTYLRVKEIAESQGLNIQTLAQKAQLSYTTVLNVWHDKPDQLNRGTLDMLAIALGVKVPDLFGGDPSPDRKNRRGQPFPAALAPIGM